MPIWNYEDIFWDLVVSLVYNTHILSQKEHGPRGHDNHNNANMLVHKSVYTDVNAAVEKSGLLTLVQPIGFGHLSMHVPMRIPLPIYHKLFPCYGNSSLRMHFLHVWAPTINYMAPSITLFPKMYFSQTNAHSYMTHNTPLYNRMKHGCFNYIRSLHISHEWHELGMNYVGHGFSEAISLSKFCNKKSVWV